MFSIMSVSTIFSILIFSFLIVKDGSSDGSSSEQSTSSTEAIYPALPLIQATVEIILNYPYFNQKRLIENEAVYVYEEATMKEKIIHLCPAEEPNDREHLEQEKETMPGIDYCLFEKPEEDTKTCQYEVEPLLIANRDPKSKMRCEESLGDSYVFAFNYCHTTDSLPSKTGGNYEILEHMFNNREYQQIYEICFDYLDQEVIWIRHVVMIPRFNGFYKSHKPEPTDDELLKKNAQIQAEKIIDKSYTMNSELFSKKHQKFQNLMKTSDQIALHTLVPEVHIPLEIWAKAVPHVINMVPVSQDLIPLINAVDIGIKKVAVNIQSLSTIINIWLGGSNLKQRYTLDIYTTTFSEENNPLTPDGWCKFIYFEAKRLGILIFIHTTPYQSPDKIRKKCNKTIGFGVEVDCNFKQWFKSQDPILDKLTQYAYCCQATESLIQKLFTFKVKVDNVLKMEEVINFGFPALDKFTITKKEMENQYLHEVQEILDRFE